MFIIGTYLYYSFYTITINLSIYYNKQAVQILKYVIKRTHNVLYPFYKCNTLQKTF